MKVETHDQTTDEVLLDVLDRCSPAGIELSPDLIERAADVLHLHGVQLDGRVARLDPPLERLSEAAITSRLDVHGRRYLRSLEIERVHPSTNTTLVERAAREPIDGCVLTTELQSAGRGRRGRGWQSLYACNIAVSLGADFENAAQLQAFSLVVGVVVALAIEDVSGAKVDLKWPNDVWFEDRKVAGILVEVVSNAESVRVVSGIGINVRLPEAARRRIDQPVSDLHDVTGTWVSRNALLAALINRFAASVGLFRERGFAAFEAAYRELDCLAGRTVEVSGGESFAGVAQGIDSSGELTVRTASGVRKVRSGEVSVRPAADPHP